jgi:hypothetical protein
LRFTSPFQAPDLEELDVRLLSKASRVVPMHDVARGDTGPTVIGMRHDVDDNPGSLDTALELARWESARGYSSTYFLLHDSYYWPEVLPAAEQFEELGHEVGIHVNAIAEALRTGRDPHDIFEEALTYLRTAARVVGCVAHGDPLCRRQDETIRFVNDELFSESARPGIGPATRPLVYHGNRIQLAPLPRAKYGLEYDANWLSRGDYISDSGGHWSQPFEGVAQSFPSKGQLHMLIHPDWWSEAFIQVGVAA